MILVQESSVRQLERGAEDPKSMQLSSAIEEYDGSNFEGCGKRILVSLVAGV
jgi:hypothetical protein